MLAACGISVTHETIRQWGLKFGQEFANRPNEQKETSI
jgi:putative transposase